MTTPWPRLCKLWWTHRTVRPRRAPRSTGGVPPTGSSSGSCLLEPSRRGDSRLSALETSFSSSLLVFLPVSALHFPDPRDVYHGIMPRVFAYSTNDQAVCSKAESHCNDLSCPMTSQCSTCSVISSCSLLHCCLAICLYSKCIARSRLHIVKEVSCLQSQVQRRLPQALYCCSVQSIQA